MAIVTVSTNQGTLGQSAQELLTNVSPYADLTLGSRIELVLDYYMDVNNAIVNDYNAGGYLNYGVLPNGQYKIDLDNYELWYTGSFSQSGSLVTNVDVLDRSTGLLLQVTGNIAYTGIPLFTGLNGISQISSLGQVNATSTEGSILLVDATINTGLIVTGQVETLVYQFLDSSGNVVRDVTGGGNVAFSNSTGSFNLTSGGFTYSSLDTRSYPITNETTILDSILIENIFVPITATSSDYNAFSGDDIVTLIGSRGSTVYVGSGNDTVFGSAYSDTIFAEEGDDLISGSWGDDTIDGGAGYDIALYEANRSSITSAAKDISGIVTLRSDLGTDTLINLEELSFRDGNVTIDDIITQYSPAVYQTNVGKVTANIYTGAVDFLEFELLGSSTGIFQASCRLSVA